MNDAPKDKQENVSFAGSDDSILDDIEEVSPEYISVDAWGNEWDDSGDFMDMDFRLVED